MRALALAAAVLLGCGVQSIELAPDQGDVVLLDPVPAAAVARLQAAGELKPEPRLTLSYPADGTALPANLAPISFLFGDDKKPMEPMKEPMKEPKSGYQAYELRLRASGADLRLYTTSPSASVPSARWRQLLQAQQGGELSIELRALEAPDRVIASKTIKLRVLAPTQSESFAYWSDTLGAAVSARFDAEPAPPLTAFPEPEPWLSLSPDGAYQASSRDGMLTVLFAGSALDLPWAPRFRVDYPAWSPDGANLLLAGSRPIMMPMMMPAESAQNGSILRAALIEPTTLGEPTPLLSPAEADESVRSPVYASDGAFIAFERVKGKDKLGKLWLMSAQGGEPWSLSAKMGWQGEGAWPTWFSSRASGEYWLVCSQARTPGVKAAPDMQQLWMVALRSTADAKLELAGEPFWLPGQDADGKNRRALAYPP